MNDTYSQHVIQFEHTINNIQAIVKLLLVRADHPVHHAHIPWLYLLAVMGFCMACCSFIFSFAQLQIEEIWQ